MGHSAKKKKRKNKGRAASKDHSSFSADYSELISEELTALCAIFQDDCSIVSESPAQVLIKLRPYSKDTGYENLDVSARLSVRCLLGYPYKCPKLLITPEKGLSKSDADRLLSLLYDQANANAREGRVMIFNLVEAAQEFLSEIVPTGELPNSVPRLTKGDADLLRSSERASPYMEPYVYGFIDLFCGSGASWSWSIGNSNGKEITSPLGSTNLPISKQVYEGVEKNFRQKETSAKEEKKRKLSSAAAKLDTLEEHRSGSATNSCSSSTDEFVDSTAIAGNQKENYLEAYEFGYESCEDHENDSSGSPSAIVLADGHVSETIKRDLMMVHLLRLASGSKGYLADALPNIASELCDLGMLSDWGRDIFAERSSSYGKMFDRVFHQHMVTSKMAQFWEPVSAVGGQNTPSVPSSRYLNDFEELKSLGHGGFGHVVLCKNKLDGRQYAIKKIRLKDKSPPLDDLILREVATLSRLQHQHVVRYYQAWFEIGVAGPLGDSEWGSRTAASTSVTYIGGSSSEIAGNDNLLESTYLYIQMEYCPRTLRQLFESYRHFDEDLAWHLFRQVVEGLAHVHGQGIIHRDLTPNNIFFDARNDIKIGDFGLAKFLKLEQLEQDTAYPADAPGVSVDRTGQVGTYFYTAPEIEQGWPKIDEKADMYSLGIVFFELWHPFGTAMERHIVLSDLKQKGELPPSWVAEFPEQASLLRRLMSPIPSDRPSATELIQQAFPPRMEYDLLDKFLRTMRTSEDTSVYDKVIGAVFDEEMWSTKSNHINSTNLKLVGNETLNIQYSDLGTETRDYVIDVSKEVFKRHCARHLEIIPMHLLDESLELKRETVKLLSHGGDMIELCHELRSPFVKWIVAGQRLSFRRYEISFVYRRAIGRSPPNRYLQGDFDIIGGAPGLTEAQVIKVSLDVLAHFFHSESCDIHINHGNLLNAIWSWTGVMPEHRQKVAELLCLLSCLQPQSPERKSRWVVIRRQLLQELNLAETVVNRLQTVGLRFCASIDQALPRLRGALSADKSTRKALDELAELYGYLRVWKIEQHIFIDVLMPPTESYHRDLFFQTYLRKESPGSSADGTLVAVGGRYDSMLHQMWEHEHKSSPPGAVGMSLALETIIQNASGEQRPSRMDTGCVLICSRGGGGLLDERMELAAELWDAGIKAEFVLSSDPSLTEQYEYANEHDIRCLVVITDSGVSQKDSAKVRHLELKREKEVDREHLVKFLLDAMASQFRNLPSGTKG